ncbi:MULTISPECIES: hypothetical protein [Bacillaceae]|uniref:hypothetical protein n=1 Tax=Metabacillus sp. 22489 TaxID=3453928 RepID=UPI000BA5E2B0|nr:hypothetical protein CHH83_18945 [Bacillus sp. 7586-K]
MDSNFGKYVVPPTLQRLIDLQNDLGDTEDFFKGLDFYLSLENFRYFNTPSDVIVFGNIGANGIHYGFLTDYGSVTELEVAPIVCVSPMDFDTPIRIVARNLREFLRVNLTDSALFYNHFSSEEKYLETKERWTTEEANSPYQPTENEKQVRERVQRFLLENFQLPHIDNPYRYVQDVGLARQRNVCIQTMDGLGVTEPLLQHEKHSPFPLYKDTDPDLKLLQEYINSAPFASRLALFRDLQLYYILQDNHELYKIVIDTMNNMGLTDEASRLMQ